MATEREHRDAVIAAINVEDGVAVTRSQAKNATKNPDSYTEVAVSCIYTEGAQTIDGDVGISKWRIEARHVALIENNAHEMRERSRLALKSARLSIDGVLTGPIQYESSDSIGDDDGWWSGLETWTYDHGI